jgi:hypothetical protein
MSDRLTKQGVRNLDPVGHNGHRSHAKRCRHHFAIRLVVGTRWVADQDYFDTYEEPIYGHKCLWCPAIREEQA